MTEGQEGRRKQPGKLLSTSILGRGLTGGMNLVCSRDRQKASVAGIMQGFLGHRYVNVILSRSHWRVQAGESSRSSIRLENKGRGFYSNVTGRPQQVFCSGEQNLIPDGGKLVS